MMDIAKKNAELNGLDPAASEYLEGDVFKELRRFRDSRRDFDLIVLDPPKFVESRNQLDKGARGYKFEIIEMGVDTEDSHVGKGSLQDGRR